LAIVCQKIISCWIDCNETELLSLSHVPCGLTNDFSHSLEISPTKSFFTAVYKIFEIPFFFNRWIFLQSSSYNTRHKILAFVQLGIVELIFKTSKLLLNSIKIWSFLPRSVFFISFPKQLVQFRQINANLKWEKNRTLHIFCFKMFNCKQ